jgi:hypothetical protein
MTKISTMSILYSRLAKAGLPHSFIREFGLPSWWNEEFEQDPSALITAAGYLTKRLGLNLASLLELERDIEFNLKLKPKLKCKNKTDFKKIRAAQAMAIRAAEMVAHAYRLSPINLPRETTQIREHILSQNKFVKLDSLLAFCLSCGIPVFHFSSFPPGTQRMDGIAVEIDGRPVIAVTSNRKSTSWLLFIVAHELGHIINKHLKINPLIIDTKAMSDNEEPMEIEANEFAQKLILGELFAYPWSKDMNFSKLRDWIKTLSLEKRVEPGALVWNYAWKTGNWGLATAVVQSLEDESDIQNYVNSRLKSYLELEKLDEDSQEYLELTLGL